MESLFYKYDDVMTLCDVGKSEAYNIIKEVNEYAKSQGVKMTIPGKCLKRRFHEYVEGK